MSQKIKNTENIIGENSVFEGSIQLNGTLKVDGLYTGSELAIDHVVVGKSGKVKSNFNCNSVVVEGAVLGNIHASTRTMLLPTAKILGDISSPELIIQNGVIWDGHCVINTKPGENVAELVKSIFE